MRERVIEGTSAFRYKWYWNISQAIAWRVIIFDATDNLEYFATSRIGNRGNQGRSRVESTRKDLSSPPVSDYPQVRRVRCYRSYVN